jgi:hypothetical protein
MIFFVDLRERIGVELALRGRAPYRPQVASKRGKVFRQLRGSRFRVVSASRRMGIVNRVLQRHIGVLGSD